jgi:hypothetical protein
MRTMSGEVTWMAAGVSPHSCRFASRFVSPGYLRQDANKVVGLWVLYTRVSRAVLDLVGGHTTGSGHGIAEHGGSPEEHFVRLAAVSAAGSRGRVFGGGVLLAEGKGCRAV